MSKRIEKTYVFDSYALFALLYKESSYKKIQQLLLLARDKKILIYFSLLSLGEVYYILIREIGKEKAHEIITKIENLPIKIISIDFAITKRAAEIKAKGGLSYADSFVIACAMDSKATIVTGDKEFKKFSSLVSIYWLKQ